ncbi:hypothetical protein BGZ72_007218 [Mortierella alpina]|nr:hypothetical protein BGZ72_007218 [Mortierella alpina]
MVANLHLLAVYRSSMVQNRLKMLLVIITALPLVTVLPIVLQKRIQNPEFGVTCVANPETVSPFVALPSAIAVCLAMLIHLGTVAYMIKVKRPGY